MGAEPSFNSRKTEWTGTRITTTPMTPHEKASELRRPDDINLHKDRDNVHVDIVHCLASFPPVPLRIFRMHLALVVYCQQPVNRWTQSREFLVLPSSCKHNAAWHLSPTLSCGELPVAFFFSYPPADGEN